MRADIGAQIALSLLAHIGVFFTANRFLSSTDIPDIDIILNTSKITETSIEIKWNLSRNDETRISSVKASLYPYKQKNILTQTSPEFKVDFNNGTYLFPLLQPHTTYNACLTVHTDKKVDLTKCVSAQTSYSGFSRLRFFSSSPEDSKTGLDLTLFLALLAFAIFIAIVISSYNMYVQAAAAKNRREYRNLTESKQKVDTLLINGCSDEIMEPLLNNVEHEKALK